MHTPSPESPDQLMTCVKAACDLGHRGPKAVEMAHEKRQQNGWRRSIHGNRQALEDPEAALSEDSIEGADPSAAEAAEPGCHAKNGRCGVLEELPPHPDRPRPSGSPAPGHGRCRIQAAAAATTGGTTAETEATDQGTDIRSQVSEPETTQAVTTGAKT